MVQSYNYTPEQAARSIGVRRLPARFFWHLDAYRAWEQMWEKHEELKREAKIKGDSKEKKRRLESLKAEFVSHGMHDLYVEHVRSDEGRAAMRQLIEQWTNR